MSEDNPPEETVKKPARKGPKIPRKITEKYLYNAGLAYLQRFPAARAHFIAVMRRRIDKSCRHHTDQDKEACYALLEAAADKFGELGYLNDELYLKGMVNSLRGRGLSATAIRMKLRQKGLKEDEIAHALAAHDEENGLSDRSAALRLCRRKRIGPYAASPDAAKDPATRQKWLASLARAGFSYEDAVRAIDAGRDDVSD